MNWTKLETEEQLKSLQEQSTNHPILIFKHSTRCNISRMALDRLERAWKPEEMKAVRTYFLDLLQHRDISSAIARHYAVEHQSPQVLLIRPGHTVYHQSHLDIRYDDLVNEARAITTN